MKSSFKDRLGRSWRLKFDRRRLQESCSELGIAPPGADAGHMLVWLGELLGRPQDLVGVLYMVCERQAVTRGVTPEEFGGLMIHEATIRAASAALVRAVAERMPQAVRREVLELASELVTKG